MQFLPSEAATVTAVRNASVNEPTMTESSVDPADGQWSATEMLLAGIIDELRWSRYEFRQVNSTQPGDPPPQVPRPGIRAQRRRLSLEERKRLDPRMRKDSDNG